MQTDTPVTTYLDQYRQPDFSFTNTELDVHLNFSRTTITATHQVSRQSPNHLPLELDCEFLEIQSVHVDGKKLSKQEFSQTHSHLILHNVPDQFELVIRNSVNPSTNTSLSGLYQSGDMLCTQCEAEGFRRITPALDRPDSLGVYRVSLTANQTDFPVLLCNGNLLERINNEDGTHTLKWDDPFPKPTYLFAIVAGKLECMEDHFTTRTGRNVVLRFYARGKDISKCHHAMESLKRSMTWDEQVYGREYDLDLFNVVAVEDFNMGAMENKSLNVFNTKYVLADSNMATDTDFDNVESVIGHEYFHNWSGNRVTCRDWFQLSLKEGFTVFRDQEFSADMGSRGVKRIDDVNVLRAHQFKEDASPMAHPVRPDSYQEINNFYTATIYNKGAEVVRMVHTLLGADAFRKGSDLYFDRHDGQAVTTDDFIRAMEDASDVNLGQFKNWYNQSGTPEVEFDFEYDQSIERYTIQVRQSCPDTPEQQNKKPFVIPIKTSLFTRSGDPIVLNNDTECILELSEVQQSFVFDEIKEKPVPSLLRGFSAPVKITTKFAPEDLLVLLAHDNDPFNRWESGQILFLREILDNIENLKSGNDVTENPKLSGVFRDLLQSSLDTDAENVDLAFLAKVLSLPSVAYISEFVSPVDPHLIEKSRSALKNQLSVFSTEKLIACIDHCEKINTGSPKPIEIAARALRDTCLDYLSVQDSSPARNYCTTLLKNSKCMTDASVAITLIARSKRTDRSELLNNFYNRWQDEPLVVDKWLRAQATVADEKTIAQVESLTEHTAFDHTNPNKVYSLILGLTHGNPFCFHARNGSGYAFLVKWIKILDEANPQVASRLVTAMNGWQKYTPELAQKMEFSLKEIATWPHLSNDVREIVTKNLEN